MNVFCKWILLAMGCHLMASAVLAGTPSAARGGGTVELSDEAIQQCVGDGNGSLGSACGRHLVGLRGRCLHVYGTAEGSELALRLNASDPSILEVDVKNDGRAEFRFRLNQFECIMVDARGGDDMIIIDEANGVFTGTKATTLIGGNGNDTMMGGSGPETLVGGPGQDDMSGGEGDDMFEWTPGDGTDMVDGDGGNDTMVVNGGPEAENFTVTANGLRVRLDRLQPSPFAIDIGTTENLVLSAGDGNDTLGCTGNLAALIKITADGGSGDDLLRGSNGADVLLGGDGDDFIDGNQGTDVALMGAGDDVFQWDPGDGSDVIEGQDDHDRLLFNGSSANELFDLSPNGERLRFTRNIGNIVMDMAGVEQIDVHALGGADVMTAGELAGTDIVEVNVDFAGTLNGSSGDGQLDSMNVIGTPGPDSFQVSAADGATIVELGYDLRVKGYESGDQVVFNGVGGDSVHVNGTDGPDTMSVIANGLQARVDAPGYSAAIAASGALTLIINGLDGADTMSCVGNLAALVPIVLDGGHGNDVLLGSNGVDVLRGGPGDDLVDGNQGNDVAHMGAGNDVFQWDPGDGSDTVEGEGDIDVVRFNGSGASEVMEAVANGARLRFTRNVGNIVMDVDGVEELEVRMLGGSDTMMVHDLVDTEVMMVNVNLAGTLGGDTGDGQPDTIIVNATADADDMVVSGGVSGVLTEGLGAAVNVTMAEAALDRLTVNGLGGDDVMQAGGLAPGVIGLTLSGGAGEDMLIGSPGVDELKGDGDNDTIMSRAGNDIVELGAGDDLFMWQPGDDSDKVEGDEGSDRVEVAGSDEAEAFTVTANGARARFDQLSPAPAFIDMGTVEDLVLHAGGGNDTLGCTGNLAALIKITADGGPGDDMLLGGNGADVLMGGDGNDLIDGNQGNDVAMLGAGDDVFQWDPGDGSDTVEGDADHDMMLFSGSGAAEIFELSANAERLRLTRNIGNIVMDLAGIEQVDIRALGNVDAVMVNDLSPTEVVAVNVDLAGTFSGGSGDGQADTITVSGTSLSDSIDILADSGAVEVHGLAAVVRVEQPEEAVDRLVVNGLGGTDTITADPDVSDLILLTVNP